MSGVSRSRPEHERAFRSRFEIANPLHDILSSELYHLQEGARGKAVAYGRRRSDPTEGESRHRIEANLIGTVLNDEPHGEDRGKEGRAAVLPAELAEENSSEGTDITVGTLGVTQPGQIGVLSSQKGSCALTVFRCSPRSRVDGLRARPGCPLPRASPRAWLLFSWPRGGRTDHGPAESLGPMNHGRRRWPTR